MTSPLFPMHNRVDQNTFMTFGREMMNGKLLYRDLFDHKGPYIYLLHGVGYLLTGNNFHGVWLLQIVFFWVFIIYIYKICQFYTKKAALPLAMMTALCVATCTSFLRGDNAEEFCLAFWAFGMYHLLKTSRQKTVPRWLFFVGGVMAGVVLCLKFTLLGFWAAWGILIFIRAIRRHSIRRAIFGTLLFGLGMAVAVAPWVIYFGIHNAIYDWLYVSFYVNIAYYSSPYPALLRPFFPLIIILANLAVDPFTTIIIFFGIKGAISRKSIFSSAEGRSIWVTFAAQLLLIGLGGVYYVYYFLTFAGYLVFGILHIYNKYRINIHKYLASVKLLSIKKITVSVMILAIFGSNCVPYYVNTKSNYVQYQFAEIMADTPDLKLLNYGFLDGGFYYAANVSPITKYIGKPNLDDEKFPQMDAELRSMIAQKIPDYVVIRTKIFSTFDGEGCAELFENYELVKEGFNRPDGYRYRLYKRK